MPFNLKDDLILEALVSRSLLVILTSQNQGVYMSYSRNEALGKEVSCVT